MQPADNPAPIPQSKRIVDLDVLRGIALFGILVVNLQLFAHPIFSLITETGQFHEWYNQAASFFVHIFFEGKFITLFSFLFGIGFYIFAQRLKMKDLSFYPVFLRRMALLFIIGFLHAWLLWAGDILVPYAIGGVLLMLFFKRRDKTIKVWIGVLVGGMTLFFTVLVFMIMFAMNVPDVAESLNEQFVQQGIEYEQMTRKGYDVHETGTFSEIMAYRGEERSFVWLGMLFSPAGLAYILAIFLFGLLIARKGILDNPQVFRDYFIRNRKRNVLIGLPISIFYAITYQYIDPIFFNYWYLLQIIAFFLGTPLLCFGYVGFILMMLQKAGESSWLSQFAPVGRMALTNYLMQSVICTTIFYGYGFGLFGKLAPWMILPVAIIIFALQVWFSRWYFERFKMGPLERLWRTGTYLKRV
jgi:uncharacterized protein